MYDIRKILLHLENGAVENRTNTKSKPKFPPICLQLCMTRTNIPEG